MATKLFKYQKKDVARIEEFNGRAILAHEMGLGKSLISLSWCALHPEKRPILIICPASLKMNWAKECAMHYGMRSAILSSTKPDSSIPPAPVYIINYEILKNWQTFITRHVDPKIIIIDEAHYISNPDTARYAYTKSICYPVKHILALSGTPLTNRPKELWSILNLLDEDEWPSFWSFKMRYCDPKMTPFGWDFNGASNLEELHRKMKHKGLIRRTKANVLKDLPDKSRSIVTFELNKQERKQYNKVLNNPHIPNLVKIGKLIQEAARAKFRYVLEWIDNYLEDTDEKLILFGVHREIINLLEKKHKDKCVVVHGSVKSSQRQLCFDQFTNNKKIRLFIGNIKAAGVGWNGTVASNVAFVELSWIPGEHKQAEDRVHRIGQTKKCHAYYLVAENTMEETLCKVLQSKQDTINSTLDGSKGDNLELYRILVDSLGENGNENQRDTRGIPDRNKRRGGAPSRT